MTEEKDGSITVQFQAGGIKEMEHYLAKYGDNVKIIKSEKI